jgi:hypothetical protein
VHTVHIFTVGATGRAIGDRLARYRPVQRHDGTDGIDPDRLPMADAYVLAAGRQVAELEQAMDVLAHERRRVLLAVAVEHPVLRLGPVVVPGSGAACAGCYHRRCRSHLVGLDAFDRLAAHYARHPHDEPAGYLPPMLDFAARQAHRLLADPAAHAGSVHMAHLLLPRVYRWTTVGIHGCPRCGLTRDERDRSSVRLAAAVAAAGAVPGAPATRVLEGVAP